MFCISLPPTFLIHLILCLRYLAFCSLLPVLSGGTRPLLFRKNNSGLLSRGVWARLQNWFLKGVAAKCDFPRTCYFCCGLIPFLAKILYSLLWTCVAGWRPGGEYMRKGSWSFGDEVGDGNGVERRDGKENDDER